MRTIRTIMKIFFILITIAVLLFSVYVIPWFVVMASGVIDIVFLILLWILSSAGGAFLVLFIAYLWGKLDNYLDRKYYIYKRGLDVTNEEKQLRLEASKNYPDDWSAAEVEVQRMVAEKAINDFYKTKEDWINYTTEQRKYYREKREAVEGVVLDERKN